MEVFGASIAASASSKTGLPPGWGSVLVRADLTEMEAEGRPGLVSERGRSVASVLSIVEEYAAGGGAPAAKAASHSFE